MFDFDTDGKIKLYDSRPPIPGECFCFTYDDEEVITYLSKESEFHLAKIQIQ